MREQKPSVVVDTNLFVSGTLLKRGTPYELLKAWRGSTFDLLLTDEQLRELRDVFRRDRIVRRYNLDQQEIDELFAGLVAAEWVTASTALAVTVRDRKDDTILAAAVGGNADFLGTGNQDLLVLLGDRRVGRLAIVTAAEFLTAIGTSGAEGTRRSGQRDRRAPLPGRFFADRGSPVPASP